MPSKKSIPDDPAALKQLVLAQQDLLDKRQERIHYLEEQVLFFKYRQFAKQSEKDISQTELFDEAEDEASADAPDIAASVESEIHTVKPPKRKAGRKPLPKELPRVRIEHDVPEHEKTCECGCQKECIGEETCEQLDIIPAVIQVNVHARKKYACKACDYR